MTRNAPNRAMALIGLGIILALAGCGGSSSSGGSTMQPPPDPDPNPGPTGGLDGRPSNTTCTAPPRPGTGASIGTARAFPNLTFSGPLGLHQAPGDSSRWYVMERGGRVVSFANDAAVATTSTFVDISANVSTSGEGGLLGMAFHPDYQSNREVFFSYTRPGLVSYISRFRSLDGGVTLDPGSEEVILTVDQPFSNHNGGNIAFGPDGFLYIGLGDGGSGGDPLNAGQDINTLLGAMLRLDVDGGTPYAIPPGNPFAGNASCAGGAGTNGCPEIYAWGFRNPWRWSFDSATGELWLGDVGQGTWEEVDRVELGGNYGWRIREGAHCFNPASGCSTSGLIDPVAEYNHSVGNSITGGYVYRGTAIPGLAGSYVYGDFGSGRIWGLFDDGNGGLVPQELLDTGFGIGSFAEGSDGELYVLDLFAGTLNAIVPGSGSGGGTVATQLSATGCVSGSDATQAAAGAIPYAVNAPFWSDGADKQRWLAIPDGTTVTVGLDGDFQFPVGTVLMKSFSLGGQLVETRLFMRHPDGEWGGYSYEWNGAGTDAILVQGGKTAMVGGQEWIFPSGAQCMECHTAASGRALGPETAQVNRTFTYPSTGRTANQLETYDAAMLLTAPLAGTPADLPAFVDPADATASLTERARTYLHVNCSHCHRLGGPTPSSMDLRFETALADTGTCDEPPQAGDLGLPGARLVAPGDSANSILAERMRRRDANGMPPAGSSLVDDAGAALVESWIDSLSACP